MFSKLFAWLDGKKLYIGGAAMILTGLGQIGMSYSNGNGFSADGWHMILAGWTAIGAKSAIAKIQ